MLAQNMLLIYLNIIENNQFMIILNSIITLNCKPKTENNAIRGSLNVT